MTDIDVTVIGGGAAGLMAAVSAARCGVRTRVIEHMDRIGKKILSTGNGKCNYTNAVQGLSCYRGENPAFVLPVLSSSGRRIPCACLKSLESIRRSKQLLLSGE